MENKTVIITGSTSGIGLGMAERFAKEGYAVLLNGFGSSAEIDALLKRLQTTYGVPVLYSGADMSKPDDIRAMVSMALDAWGHVDVLINNAGIQFTSPAQDFPDDRWESILSINLSAVFYATKAVLPSMIARNTGRIINIASVHGLVASVHKAAYVAAKHGVVGLTKVVALETAESGITVNAICPGWVLTPLVQKQIDAIAQAQHLSQDEARDVLLSEKQPSKQFVTPESLADLALFLASPAAEQLTGQALAMDGGWTAR